MIVHISQTIVVNKVMEIHTKPANARQRPAIAPVKPCLPKKTIDQAGDLRFHSADRPPLNHIFSHMSIFLRQDLAPSNCLVIADGSRRLKTNTVYPISSFRETGCSMLYSKS